MDDFARTWLGITKPSAWREAVSTALLGDWTGAGCTCGVNNDTVVVHLLMEETRILHRQLQPLWECKAAGRRLRLMGAPLPDGAHPARHTRRRCLPDEPCVVVGAE